MLIPSENESQRQAAKQKTLLIEWQDHYSFGRLLRVVATKQFNGEDTVLRRHHDDGRARVGCIFSAVGKLFGPEQAELAAEDWLQELVGIDSQPVATREWRLVTIKASKRLAGRLKRSHCNHDTDH